MKDREYIDHQAKGREMELALFVRVMSLESKLIPYFIISACCITKYYEKATITAEKLFIFPKNKSYLVSMEVHFRN